MQRQRTTEAAIALALAVVAVAACWPVLQSGARWGYWDWDIFQSAFEAARVSVTEYGQLPGWNPYLRGGESLVRHPLLPLASPSFAVILALGTVPGIKLWIAVRQFAALWGAYWLGRRLALGRLGALTVAALFGLASCYAQRVAHGHWNLQALAYLPLVVGLGLAAVEPARWRSRALAAAVLALMFLDGGPYTLVFAVLGLLAAAAVGAARGSWRSALAGAGVAVGLGLALAAVKLLPVLAGSAQSAEPVPYGPGVMLDFYDPDFSPSLGEWVHAAWLERHQANRPGRFPLFLLNVGAYVGPLGLALIVLGAVSSRVARAALLLGLPLLWLCLGAAAPLNLWAIVHHLPIADAMRAPGKFTACYLLAFAVAGGAGMDALEKRLGARRLLRWVPATALALLTADLIGVSHPVFAHAFPVEPFEVERGAFHQREFTPFAKRIFQAVAQPLALHPASARPRHSLTANYPAVRANFGVLRTITGNRSTPGIAVAPDRGGELGVTQESERPGAEPHLVAWSPNALRIEVDPARGGVLVVNHNYDAGWHAESEGRPLPVVSHGLGVLGVPLEGAGAEVSLEFHTPWRRAGALVSVLAAVVAMLLAFRPPPRQPSG